MKREIIFPPGGGGNHIRWLMYFDKNFDPEKSLEEKFNFIKEKVYSKKRTHYNWIEIEFQYRGVEYDKVITLLGNHVDPGHDEKDAHTLFVKYNDWTNPFEHYFCLNPSLNSKHPETFKKYFFSWFNEEVDAKGTLPAHKKVILGDTLWNNTLDKELYYAIIDFWKLEDHYEYAAEIHKLWRRCSKKAYKDFYEYYTSEHFHNYLKSISLKGSSTD
jgi:hypothetical protein